MHQIEMLGLLEHDVLASIQVPFLPDSLEAMRPTAEDHFEDYHEAYRLEVEKFDLERFALRTNPPIHLGKDSAPSSGATIILDSSSYRSHALDKRPSYVLQRTSTIMPRIAPIEESPRKIYMDLPLEDDEKDNMGTTTVLSSSPSSSIRTSKSENSKTEDESKSTTPRPTLGSKLT